MSQIRFLPVLHLHVPVGLTERDRKMAFDRWFAPLLLALRDRTNLRMTLHFSGYLLRWLGLRQARALKLVNSLQEAGRVELLAGGWADPFLTGIPRRDAVNQIELQSRILESRCGARPRGAYLCEGVWDPHLPELFHEADIRYAFVPGEAFLAAGVRPSRLAGWYVTERSGAQLAVIPTDPQVAGAIGHTSPAEALSILERRRAMGIESVAWVASVEQLAFQVGAKAFSTWLHGFFDLIEDSLYWLRLGLPSELLDKRPCEGRVYLPSWIPARLAEGCTGLSEDELTQAEGGRRRPYTRAGSWEGLLVRYEEGNRIHKRMMAASLEVDRLRVRLAESEDADPARVRALELACLALYRAQGSAVYWPGPRGGIYEPALRAGAYGNLCEAESLVSRTLGESARIRAYRADFDCDGTEEVLVRTPHFGGVINPDGGGSLVELGSWTMPGNILDCISRREEPWHHELHDYSLLPSLVLEEEEPTEVTDAYELFVSGDEDSIDEHSIDEGASRGAYMQELASILAFDRVERGAFIDRFLGPATTLANLEKSSFPEEGDFANGAFQVVSAEPQGPREFSVLLTREGRVRRADEEFLVQIRKRYLFLRDRPALEVHYSIVNRSLKPVSGRFGVEVNLGASSSNPRGSRLVIDRCEEVHVGEASKVDQVEEVALHDPSRELKVVLRTVHAADLWHYPVRAIRRGGLLDLETSYQGVCLILSWPVQLWGEEKREFRLSLAVETNGRR